MTTDIQKGIEETLKGMEWLSREGHEVEKQLVYIKMHNLKTLKYKHFTSYLKNEYGNDFYNDNNTDNTDNTDNNDINNIYDIGNDNNIYNETDDYDGKGENIEGENIGKEDDETNQTNDDFERLNNDLGLDNYEEAEMAEFYEGEDDEDADQDYY